VFSANPTVVNGDVTVGHLNNPSDLNEVISTDPSIPFNTVRVTVRRDETTNAPSTCSSHRSSDGGRPVCRPRVRPATRTALWASEPTSATGNCELLPLALHVNAWKALLAHAWYYTDKYAWDAPSRVLSAGTDGIPELNLYPGSGTGQLPPGNFGTVNIGNPSNAAADLSRQIRYGVSEADLAYYPAVR